MTLNDYELEYQDAKAEHTYIAFEKKYPHEQPARAQHEAHLLRAHARLMRATRNYELAKAAILAVNKDTDVDAITSAPTLDDKIRQFFQPAFSTKLAA